MARASSDNIQIVQDHNLLTNTHNLTTDIDHDTITNGHNLTTDIDHDTLTNFDSEEHFLQTAITNVSTALSTGLLKVTTGTGALTTAVANTDYQTPLTADTDYLTPGTAATTYQPLDAGLTSISGLTTAADKMIYTTALDTYAVADLTSFARQLLDDADAATMRTTLDVDQAGTDNSTAVTLTNSPGTYDYLTISGQAITLAQIDLTTDVTGLLPDGNISSAATWNAKQDGLTFGIANTNAVQIDSVGVADNDYAKFTANGLEGRSAAEVKTDLSLNNVENVALSSWTGDTSITTVGTIGTGTWQGTAIGDTYISSATTWNAKLTSPLTTKGDILTYSTVDARLAVGTNGQYLVADSGETTGLRYIGENTELAFACSDESTDLTTGQKIAIDMPYNMTVTRVYASVTTAPVGSALTVDVEDEGVSILNAVVSIAASTNNAETSSFTGATSSYALTKGDLVTIDVDQIGATTAGAGLVVHLVGVKTV